MLVAFRVVGEVVTRVVFVGVVCIDLVVLVGFVAGVGVALGGVAATGEPG